MVLTQFWFGNRVSLVSNSNCQTCSFICQNVVVRAYMYISIHLAFSSTSTALVVLLTSLHQDEQTNIAHVKDVQPSKHLTIGVTLSIRWGGDTHLYFWGMLERTAGLNYISHLLFKCEWIDVQDWNHTWLCGTVILSHHEHLMLDHKVVFTGRHPAPTAIQYLKSA